MPSGFEVYDAAGQLVLGVTDRLTIMIGSLSVSSGTGNISVPAGMGTPFAYAVPNASYDDVAYHGSSLPKLTISGTTITYTYPSGISGFPSMPATIFYGFY